jgi:hypothetical protein
VLSACGAPPECETSTDCQASGKCMQARCSSAGACQNVPITDCCGNLQCEANENTCSCNQDCKMKETASGTCSGPVQIPIPGREGKFTDTLYAQYACVDNACIVTVPADKVEVMQFLKNNMGSVEFDVTTSISQPFMLGSGTCTVRIKLTDLKTTISNVKLTGIQVLTDNELIAEKTINAPLTGVGTSYEESLILKPVLAKIETKERVIIKINYEYTEMIKDNANIVRTALSNTYSDIIFVDPKKAP